MTVPVPFGQYVPGSSAVHRLDPRVKLAMAIAYVTMLFGASGWTGLAIAGVAGYLFLRTVSRSTDAE